jgi:heme-degrading monooxygenase HmoA
MAVISNDTKAIELINIITVEPEDQQAMVDTVSEILEDIAEKQPGFVSFKVYKSLDRTRVAYFIRWRSQNEGLAWFEDIRDALKVSKSRVKNADYHLYEVIEDLSL